MFFVTLPVRDVKRSKEFFAQLGFGFDPRFTDDANTAACMPIGEQAVVMLLEHERWAEFSKRPMADPATHAVALFCFSVGSREEVDTVADAAIAAGAEDHDDADDHGFMYSRSFFDLDGHGWQVMWMDLDAAEVGPEDTAQPAAGGAKG
jgi:predicted lactoylglutathione lyase